MQFEDRIRSALRPLMDAGIVQGVRFGGEGSYVGSPELPKVHPPIAVAVSGQNREQHHAEIKRLISDAGFPDVMLRIEASEEGS